MTTDPGDLVLDPTCGSGTTAYVAEQWGRRWITIDTSRVALALARARIMGARYPYYLLADSKDGQQKEAEVTHSVPSEAPTHGNIRQGFVYRARAAHHPQVHRQQRRNRCDLGEVSRLTYWNRCASKLNAALKQESGKNGKIPREARTKQSWPADQANSEAARRMVAAAHRPPEGNRRLHRRQSRLRIPLRQALRRQTKGPRRRAVHGREPLAAPRPGRR